MFKSFDFKTGLNNTLLSSIPDPADLVPLPGFQSLNLTHFDLSDLNLTYDFLGNQTTLDLNLSSLLEASLWPSLQPHNWKEQAEKLLMQPEYIVMLVLCFCAILTNMLSIIAILHVKHSLTMHLKLIINLAASDLLIVFSVFIHIINKIFNSPLPIGLTAPSERLLNACIYATVSSFHIMSFLISLLNLLAMAIDHYIAIMKPLRYNNIMSKRHGYVLVLTLWVVAAFGGFSNFLGLKGYEGKKKLFNFCEYIMYDSYHAEFLVFTVTIICLFSITFIYLRIYCAVRKIQTRTHALREDSLHNKKAMLTSLLIIGTFSICWIPNWIFQVTMIIQVHLNQKVVSKLFSTYLLLSKYLYILQLMNCVLDPIIYAVRLNIVKIGYKNFLNKLRKKIKSTKQCLAENDSLILRAPPNSFSSRRPTLQMGMAQDIDTFLTNQRQLQIPLNHLQSLADSDTYYKISEESDINENEIVALVTFHENFEKKSISNMDETSV